MNCFNPPYGLRGFYAIRLLLCTLDLYMHLMRTVHCSRSSVILVLLLQGWGQPLESLSEAVALNDWNYQKKFRKKERKKILLLTIHIWPTAQFTRSSIASCATLLAAGFLTFHLEPYFDDTAACRRIWSLRNWKQQQSTMRCKMWLI